MSILEQQIRHQQQCPLSLLLLLQEEGKENQYHWHDREEEEEEDAYNCDYLETVIPITSTSQEEERKAMKTGRSTSSSNQRQQKRRYYHPNNHSLLLLVLSTSMILLLQAVVDGFVTTTTTSRSNGQTTIAKSTAGGLNSNIGPSCFYVSQSSDRRRHLTSNPVRMSITPPADATPGSGSNSRSGRSLEEKQRELQRGNNLVGGAVGGGVPGATAAHHSSMTTSSDDKHASSDPTAVSVMDFGAVKDETSKAEQALRKARLEYLQSLASDVSSATPNIRRVHTSAVAEDATATTSALMGINREVIEEVGHKLGTYATSAKEVQECAAWLRSKAPKGLFELSDKDNTFDKSKISSYKSILEQAYEESGEVTSAFAKTFYLGTQLMAEDAKRAIWAIYVWCRRTDEIVDAPRPGPNADEIMLRDLSEWEIRLERLWSHGEVVDVLDLPLLDVRTHYPSLQIQPFVDMIRGMLMDIPGLGQDRYDTFDELHLYCYRVAGTVGLMSMPIFGCSPQYTDDDAKEPALSLGVAFQLTNILRDVGEDADRGRIYLPQEDLEKFGITEDDIFNKHLTPNYIKMMKYQIERARRYYTRAKRGVAMLAPESRWPVQSSLDCYSQILDKIELNGYDSLTKRAYVSKWEKLATLPASWYRTLDISQMFPLPGDDDDNKDK